MSEPTKKTQAEHWGGQGGRHWVEFQTRYDSMLRDFGDRAIAAAGVAAGESILDVGCGCGETTLAIARRVGTSGRAVGVDLSGPMLARARERAREEGLANVRFDEGNAQTHALTERAFDALVSRFGVMFFDDPRAAFANIAGALRAGGRVGFVCWQTPMLNEWLLVPATAIAQHVGMPQMDDPTAPGPFAFADADRVRAILTGAGLDRVEAETLTLPMRLGSDVDDTLRFFTQTEFARRLFEGAAPEKIEAAIGGLRTALTGHLGPEGVVFKGTAWLVTARRP